MARVKDPIVLNNYFPYLLRSISGRIAVGTSTVNIGAHRIGMREWRILSQMADRGPLTNKDIADDTGMDKASVSRALKYLEQQNLVQPAPNGDDNWRSKPFDLTDEGGDVYCEIAAQKLARADQFWSDMSKSEQKELIRLLQKLKNNVDRVLNQNR
ncbi:MarR family transcriptional regulator [Pseudomaricurvus alkylphenolicus]|uniref:MarR family transcriptional regulator n=1 Tax=Pseudomaricurvus alkylphenolicus TaxID=1306991 RepID=UPI00141D85CA|nr:MarR family transcriptional regulator [Pseudomaricurvus alkylphenolicus]